MGELDISVLRAREQWAPFPLNFVEDFTILRRFDVKCNNFSVFLKSVTISHCLVKQAQTKQGKRSAPCTYRVRERGRKREGRGKEEKRKRGKEEERRGREREGRRLRAARRAHLTVQREGAGTRASEAGQAQRALHIASKRKRKEEGRKREEGRGRGGGCAPRGARISQCSGREEGQAQTKQGKRSAPCT